MSIYKFLAKATHPDLNNDGVSSLFKKALENNLGPEVTDDEVTEVKKALFPTLEPSDIKIAVQDYDGYKVFRTVPSNYEGNHWVEINIYNPSDRWATIPWG